MKKISLFYILVFFFSLPSKSKDNFSTIPGLMWENDYNGEKTWILKSIETDINGKRSISTHYITNMFSETAIVNGMDCIDLREPVKDDNGNIVFRHYIFNESNGMIYRYDEDDKILYKCYDFTLQEGGVINCLNGSGYEVTSIGQASDYAPYWSTYCPNRRIMYMHRLDTDGYDVWIEGIGSVHYGIYEPSDFKSSEVFVQSVFSGGYYDDCAFFRIDTDVLKSCPFEGEILDTSDPLVAEMIMEQLLSDDIPFDMEFLSDTLHVSGTFYSDTRLTLKTFEAEIDNNIITLDVTEPILFIPSSGAPFRFDVKIPGFKAGTYKIRYKDKNPVELVCTDDATRMEEQTILNPQSSIYDSNAIYDLSGRRLTSPPNRGIYIENGRKKVR